MHNARRPTGFRSLVVVETDSHSILQCSVHILCDASQFLRQLVIRGCANSLDRTGLANNRTTPSLRSGEYKVYSMVRVVRLCDESSNG